MQLQNSWFGWVNRSTQRNSFLQRLAVLALGGSVWLTASLAGAATASVGKSIAFRCTDTEATIRALGGPRVAIGTTSFYIGYQQVSSTNKNPILIRFNAGRRAWCRVDYEVTGDDSTGYGLVWNGGDLYAAFSSTGTQGTPAQDFRRFATRGWLPSYGSGGGAKVAVVARIDPTNGNVRAATFLSSVLSNGRSNSLQVERLVLNANGNLQVIASAWSFPRRGDRSRMTCNSGSPYPYTLVFLPNLNQVVRASATGCR